MSADLIHAIYAINPNATSALYRQIIEQTKQGIRAGLLKTGQQLPSVRTLASNLQLNPMTISKAFSQLEQQGVLERRKGVGMLVAAEPNIEAIEQPIERTLNHFIHTAKENALGDDAILNLVNSALIAHNNRNKS